MICRNGESGRKSAGGARLGLLVQPGGGKGGARNAGVHEVDPPHAVARQQAPLRAHVHAQELLRRRRGGLSKGRHRLDRRHSSTGLARAPGIAARGLGCRAADNSSAAWHLSIHLKLPLLQLADLRLCGNA